jgi:hypothetical protein
MLGFLVIVSIKFRIRWSHAELTGRDWHQLHTDAVNADTSEATIRDSVPWFLGQVHPNDITSFALDASSSVSSDDGLTHIVTVQFGPWPEGATNPLAHPSLESWGVQQSTVAIERDSDGLAIRNSASIPYLDPVEVIVGLPTLTITKNQPFGFNPAFAYIFIEKTNSNSFRGAPPGTVKVLSISSDEQFDPLWTGSDVWWESVSKLEN